MRSKENTQVMVGIPKGAIHDFYADEAKEWGVKLPTFIYQLLKDRYDVLQGKEGQHTWFPRGTELVQVEKKQTGVSSVAGDIEIDPKVAISAFGGEDDD